MADLEHQLSEIIGLYNTHSQPIATAEMNQRFDQEAASAANELRRRTPSSFDAAETLIDQIGHLHWRFQWNQPKFVSEIFRNTVGERHLSTDKAAFDLLVADGENALKAEDYAELRMIVQRIWSTQIIAHDIKGDVGKLASVLRG